MKSLYFPRYALMCACLFLSTFLSIFFSVSTQVYAFENKVEITNIQILEWKEKALITLVGQDRNTEKKCYLYILDIQGDLTSPDSSITLATSYSHGRESFGVLVVNKRTEAGILYGKKNNDFDSLSIFFKNHIFDFNQIRLFNLKWWHVNHYHNYSCLDLKPVDP
jgi:hypothetical protein